MITYHFASPYPAATEVASPRGHIVSHYLPWMLLARPCDRECTSGWRQVRHCYWLTEMNQIVSVFLAHWNINITLSIQNETLYATFLRSVVLAWLVEPGVLLGSMLNIQFLATFGFILGHVHMIEGRMPRFGKTIPHRPYPLDYMGGHSAGECINHVQDPLEE